MTDDERARAKQLVLAINEISEQQWDHGDERDLERILAFARDERRRAYTEVLGEARRRAEATPQIEYIAALAFLALADWCEYKQQAEAPHG